MMRGLLLILAMLVLTPYWGARIIWAALRGVPDTDDAPYDRLPRKWARTMLKIAGAQVVVHNPERIRRGEPRIYVSNHVSWFDVFALAAVLPRYRFVAKAELTRIPIFGAATKASVLIPIERDNRKAAFKSYDEAAELIRAGSSVIVFPEGTRGRSYALRQFKKGPFVLAINAGVPIVPVIVHGTIEIMPKGSFRVRPGRIDVHLLEEIDTTGLAYDDRGRLTERTWTRMADAMRALYAVESPAPRRDQPAEPPVEAPTRSA